MDGNGRSGHPFHCVDEMDGGRGMDRHAGLVAISYALPVAFHSSQRLIPFCSVAESLPLALAGADAIP